MLQAVHKEKAEKLGEADKADGRGGRGGSVGEEAASRGRWQVEGGGDARGAGNAKRRHDEEGGEGRRETRRRSGESRNGTGEAERDGSGGSGAWRRRLDDAELWRRGVHALIPHSPPREDPVLPKLRQLEILNSAETNLFSQYCVFCL